LIAACPQHKTLPPFLADQMAPGEKCPTCQGVGVLACPPCKNKKEIAEQWAEADGRVKQLIEAAQTALKSMHEFEAADRLNYKTSAFVTPYFAIATTIDRKHILGCMQHGVGVIAKLNAAFKGEQFSFTLPADTRWVLLNTNVEYKRFLETVWKERFPDSDPVLGAKGSGQHSYNLPSTGVTCFEKINRSPTQLQHNVVHFLSHFLLNRVSGIRSYPPWLEEGFAVYGEALEMGTPAVYCFAYTENSMDIKNRDATLRRLAQKPLPMERICKMNFQDMKAEEFFQANSLVQMLVERDPQKFIALLQALPAGTPEPGGLRIEPEDQDKALQETYGYDFPKLLLVWQRWLAR
jgi:hypothetical protein